MNKATLFLCLCLAAAAPAGAATSCRIVSGGSLAFGDYDVSASAPKDTLATILVRCDRDGGPQQLDVTVTVDQGIHASGNTRRMQHTGGSGDTLVYGLYRDPARSGAWGTAQGVDTVTTHLDIPNKSSASASFTVYGRIPVRQDVSAGDYIDSVRISILY